MKITAHNRDDKSGTLEIEPETKADETQLEWLYQQLDKERIRWWFSGKKKVVVVTELQ